jgi:hypothetical protein
MPSQRLDHGCILDIVYVLFFILRMAKRTFSPCLLSTFLMAPHNNSSLIVFSCSAGLTTSERTCLR